MNQGRATRVGIVVLVCIGAGLPALVVFVLWGFVVSIPLQQLHASGPGHPRWWLATALVPALAVAGAPLAGASRTQVAMVQLGAIPLALASVPDPPPALGLSRLSLVDPRVALLLLAAVDVAVVSILAITRSGVRPGWQLGWSIAICIGVWGLAVLPIRATADDVVQAQAISPPPRLPIIGVRHEERLLMDSIYRFHPTRILMFEGSPGSYGRVVRHYRSLGWDLQEDDAGRCATSGHYSLEIRRERGIVTATATRFAWYPKDCSGP